MSDLPPGAGSHPASLSLRDHVLWQLAGGYARPSLAEVAERINRGDRGRVLPGCAHSPWQIVRHLFICQEDLLAYALEPEHVSPDFPAGLWPANPVPPTAADWDRTLARYAADRERLCDLVRTAAGGDESTGLLAGQPHLPRVSWLRQALIVSDHESYHTGQLATLAAAFSRREGDGADRR